MDELISRQAAIDAIGEKSDEIYKTKQKGATYPHDDFFQGMAYAEDVVKQLPPIQPEPKRGKWILDRSGAYCCSECMEPCAGYVMMKPRDKFCKMCGSRNEVNNESN